MSSTTTKKTVVDLSRVDVTKLSKKQLKAMTNKKQRQELKLAKKSLQRKTQTDRAREVLDIQTRLRDLELDEKYAAIRQLFGVLESFVATGEPAKGDIPFPECPPYPLGRTIKYNFTNAKGHQGTCDLIINSGERYLEEQKAQEEAETVSKFQSDLEQAMAAGTLFPPGVGEGMAQVVETLLEQARNPVSTDAVVEVIE